MRRLSRDDGAVAVLVALLSLALFGFGALVIDVGMLYAERRDLQNGADAAAFAVAQACAGGACGAYDSDAEQFADANALDEASDVTEVCGAGAALPACANPPAVAGSGYVRVTVRTEEADGGNVVPPALARVMVPDYDGTEVGAQSTVAWGPPAGIEAELAITFSQCEYDKLTLGPDTNGDDEADPVYATEPYDVSLQRTVYFHDTTEAAGCPAGPSGADLPGGFGWLEEEGDCQATIENGWVGDDTGASASQDCKAALDALLGETVLIPVFDDTNGLTGTNGEYHIWSYVGFVLTGYRFPGAAYPTGSDAPCDSSQTCVQGYFVQTVVPATGPVGDGPDQGVTVTQLVS